MISQTAPRMLAPSLAIVFLLASQAQCAEVSSNDGCEISVVGAGIGGLYSAWRLTVDSNKVDPSSLCIFEAKNRIGGRILSVTDPLPGWDGYSIDLGAYRYHRSLHHHVRLLVEDVFAIPTRCYTDSLGLDGGECISGERKIVSTRGRLFGLDASGGDADDVFSKYGPEIPYVIGQANQWGPNETLTTPREPYDFLIGETSVIPEVRARWVELTSEESYEKAMKIGDEIIEAMKSGSYRGASYSEVSLNQAAIAEGLTSEEMAAWFQSD